MNKCFVFLGSILLGCFVVPMHYFISNYPQFDLQTTFSVIALFGAIALGIAGLLWLLLRDIYKVSFLLYGGSAVFWFSHPIAVFFRGHSFFQKISISGYHWPLLFVCCFASIFCLFLSLKYCPKLVENLSKRLSAFVLILSALLLIGGCHRIFSEIKTTRRIVQKHQDNRKYPNIYHILLDAHPNAKAMGIIGGNLEPFYRELKSLGFVIFPESRSNYPATMWSVASMLNMDYLDEGWEEKPIEYFRREIHENKVFKHFQKEGYSVFFATDNIMVKSLYNPSNGSVGGGSNDFFMQLYCVLCGTPVKHIYEKCFSELFKQGVLAAIETVFKDLEAAKNIHGDATNVFYAHVLCPHEPCVFGKRAENLAFSGFIMKFDTLNFIKPEIHKAYCENVYGIDNLVLRTVREIVKQYSTEAVKPIIVLHSDHSILYNARNLESPFITPDTVYGNLLALYVPEDWKQDTKGLKFINLYRWIFNHLFGNKYEYFKENLQK